MTQQMQINGLTCTLNLPEAPKGEGVHALPPYARREVYSVDDWEGCPANWMHGSAKAASYFVGVEPGRHLWLDFNENWGDKHDVAIVISVQGINPVTGKKTDTIRLEQYREKCPVHDKAFGADRFCADCGYRWPAQNYLATASTPMGLLWVDGWRADGERIRGFLISEETMSGVAAQLIGNDRVYAIGIAFYRSKQPKPVTMPIRTRGGSVWQGPTVYGSNTINELDNTYADGHTLDAMCDSFYEAETLGAGFDGIVTSDSTGPDTTWHFAGTKGASGKGMSAGLPASSPKRLRKATLSARGMGQNSVSLNAASLKPASLSTADASLYSGEIRQITEEQWQAEQKSKLLEIAAGAKIKQSLDYCDLNPPEYYSEEPAGFIYINYCDSVQLKQIFKQGKKDRTKGGEGFLAGLKTGNP